MHRFALTLAASLAAMIGLSQVRPAAAQAQGPDDPTIIAIFDAANTVDMETGALAAERAQTPSVREFGKMLARDHQVVRQQGRDLAAKLKVTPTPPADRSAADAHAKAMTSLRGKSGLAFDRAFLEHEVAFHAAVIDAVKTTLLPAIDNAELRALVVKVAPAFEAHRQAAQQLLDKLPATSY
ncbi:MAG: DUF4142 domain-containing protein [Gemmatimonadales bacterium]